MHPQPGRDGLRVRLRRW